MEYRDEPFRARKGLGLHSENSQERRKKNEEQPKDLSRMYFVSPRSQEYHTKYDANLYKKVMLMISI